VIILLIYALSVLVISWELALALKESKARFDSAGVKLIAVGVGTPDKARVLAERVISLSTSFHFGVFMCLTDLRTNEGKVSRGTEMKN